MRAPRLPHRLPLLFRPVGEPGWQEAEIENVSTSGLLFSAERDLPVDADLELRITLSTSGYAPTASCRARVVRTEDRPSGVRAFAVTLNDCQLIPPEEDFAKRH